MLPNALLNQTVSIIRRASTGRDVLNNPTYGTPTSGSGWSPVYTNLAARLALFSRPIIFAKEGERVTPNGIVYLNPGPKILEEDRILTASGIEYVIISVIEAVGINGQIDHLELQIQLP